MDKLRYAVICVDDDSHILQMLSFQLEKIIDVKCTLLEYFTDPKLALEGLDELISIPLDVIFIIVDYQMPEMNGAQLIRAIKEKHPNLECIMLSGQANSSQVNDLQNDKMLSHFISKPWEEATLFQALRPIIENKTC